VGNIVLLDELTINKIAAGEVIERPASVVKELIENAIDAGSTKITVEVQNGGISKIRIIDNGCGMSKDDLEFAFERHATSKIRKADDLEVVTSMGFRGEALASIAAIANVEMISKMEGESTGNRIAIEAGKVLETEEAGSQNGTTITVTNLFFNTPVRYKFLKKDYTELGYIEDAVTRIALARPDIAIKLVNENKTIIQTPGDGDLKNAIYLIYGKGTADGVLAVDYTYEDIKVKGFVGKPEIARNNRAYQIFFVNNRYIKDKTLSAGAEQAFKGLLQIGKYGFVILNLKIDPSKIDVNVHPTKLEIRFEEEQKVFKAVYNSMKETLLKGDLVKNVGIGVEEVIEVPKKEDAIVSIEAKHEEPAHGRHGLEEQKEPKKQEAKDELFIEPSKENSIEDLYNKKNSEPTGFTDMYQRTFGKLFSRDNKAEK